MHGLTEGLRLAERYVLLRPLGDGGMATTWKAEDTRAGNIVALKFLDDTLAAQAAHRELFRKEWQLASRLMHPHIARVFEFHDEPDRPFFAMQYLDGEPVGVLSNEPLEVALPPVALIADALRYAHGKSIVHRDIKASNVLLDGRGSPHLLDFGIAAASAGGTPINASPGQRAGRPPEPADDVYALGVLLHEILAGRPPQDAGTTKLTARPNGEAIPTAVQELVAGMLAAEATHRPSAQQVVDRLDAAGFPGGVARRVARAAVVAEREDITVKTVSPVSRPKQLDPSTHQPVADQGISPKIVYGSAAVLVLALVSVLFVLPLWVDSEQRAAQTAQPVDEQAEQANDVTDAAPEATETEVASSNAVDEKPATDEVLGDLLSQLERLRFRGIERWGGQPYLDALQVYAEGDRAYVDRDYVKAGELYRQTLEAIEPFFDQIDGKFREAMAAGESAFGREDFVEAIRQYDLATAITPNDQEAARALERARNLEAVLDLMLQGDQYRDELALEPAKLAYEKALELDPEWRPAESALAEVRAELKQQSFESRMTEGFEALARDDFASARAAFNAAKRIDATSREPADGLQQLDQAVRLARIQQMENEALTQENGEQWEAAITTYESLLEVDADLMFAQEGLSRAQSRAGLHRQLQGYIDAPDSLSDPNTMQQATQTLLGISRMETVGPRLADQKDELSRLLKRAATPLTIELLSDNATEVSVFRVGKLGTFASRELSLRPGSYVAVGVRPGYRDVRLEFRVAPELPLEPIVVRCEEPI